MNDSQKSRAELAAELEALRARLLELETSVTRGKQTEEALQRQKAYFEQLFESSPEGILMVDNEDRTLAANKGFEELFQYSIEEIRGRSVNEFIIPEHLLDEASELTDKALQGNVVQKETVRKQKDGSVVDVEILGYPIFMNDELVGAYVIYRNITERKKAEEALRESEEKYRLHFENVTDIIYSIDSIDRELRLTHISPSVETVLGYQPEDIIGRKIDELNLLSPEYYELAASNTLRILQGKRNPRTEYKFVAKDGSIKVGEVSSAPLFQKGKIAAAVGIARDITDRKRAEQALEESEER